MACNKPSKHQQKAENMHKSNSASQINNSAFIFHYYVKQQHESIPMKVPNINQKKNNVTVCHFKTIKQMRSQRKKKLNSHVS